MDRRQRKLLRTSVFLGKLLAAGAIFQLVLYLYPSTYGLQSVFAELVSGILKILGVGASSQGVFVLLESGSYRITQDCLGWKSMAAFLGLMFASSSPRDHLRFIAVGLGVLVLANFARVVSTVYLSHYRIISFSIIHGTLWKWGLTAVVLGLWVYWLGHREPLYNTTRKFPV